MKRKCLRNLLSLFTKLLIIYCYLTYLIPGILTYFRVARMKPSAAFIALLPALATGIISIYF